MVAALVLGYGQEADGSINEQTEDRCLKALRLYRTRRIEKIYLTVSASKNGISMASEMWKFLVGHGVNRNDIVVERRGGNTAGEIDVFLVCTSRLLGEVRYVFVSTWYHLPRIIWLASWRLQWRFFSVAVAWRHVHFRGDFLKEFLKLGNAILRPRRSSKVIVIA